MADSFPAQVRRAFGPLLQSGSFRLVEEEIFTAFENAAVVLQGGAVRLRIMRERGQTFANFASLFDRNAWVSSSLVARLLTGVQPPSAVIELDQFARWVDDNLPALRERFGLRQYYKTMAELRRLEAAASARRRFGK